MHSKAFTHNGMLEAIGDASFVVHHHGDFSGDVIIEHIPTEAQLEVPFAVLKALVGEYMQNKAIEKIEQTEPKDFVDQKGNT